MISSDRYLVHDFLEHSAASFPDKIALIVQNQCLTYAEVEAQVNALSRGLMAGGVKRGDRVMVWYGNTLETCFSIFAILKTGAAFVVINPLTKRDKFLALVNDCKPSAIITDSRRARQIEYALLQQVPAPRIVVIEADPGRDSHHLSFYDMLFTRSTEPPQVKIIDRDLAALIYTSGSTGLPKGVMCAHYNMVAAAKSITQYLENTPDDIIINVLPFAFDYGLYQLLMAFLIGGTLVLENSFAFPLEILNVMRRERVTGFPGVPSMFAMLLQLDPKHLNLPDLRYVTNTGAALPVWHIRQLQQLFGDQVRIYSMYGQTECKRTLYLPPEELDHRPDSVGIAIPNEEVFVLDEDGNEVPPGEVGELYVRGANVMLGYWQRPEDTAETYLPGPLPGERILRSFDLFRRDEEGFLYFVSRTDDIIKSRGQKVSPKEVESTICQIAGVAEVAVIGTKHGVWGEAIEAHVALEEGVEVREVEILRYCRAHLEDFMVPESVIFHDRLPKNPSGKIDYPALRKVLQF